MKILLSPETFIELVPSIGGNVDLDYYVPSIRVAQELFVKPLLTKPLYRKIETDFITDNLVDEYLELYQDYVQYLIAYSAASHFVSIHPLKIGNGGIQKMSSEYGTPAEKNEVDFLVQNYRATYEHFATETVKFLQEVRFDEYPTNIKPNNGLIGGWFVSDKADRIRNAQMPRRRYSINSGLWLDENCDNC
jgi:hypothetical protein